MDGHGDPTQLNPRTHNFDVTETVTVSQKEARKMQAANVVRDDVTHENYWFEDTWLGHGVPPFVVRPIRLDPWIIDGGNFAKEAAKRGIGYDTEQVENLLGRYEIAGGNKIDVVDGALTWPRSNPTVSQISSLPLFPHRPGTGCNTYRGVPRDPADFGELPLISQLIYNGDLVGKTNQQINEELYAAAKTADVRVFNQGGSLAQLR